MARNLSVQQFQQLLARIPPALAAELDAGVRGGAEGLAEAMRSVVSVGKTGNLKQSIRAEKGRKPLSYLVKAGGSLTTKEVRGGSGKPYDYSLAGEFGTGNEAAQPFFWPSYRLRKKNIRSAISRKVRPAMKKVVNVE